MRIEKNGKETARFDLMGVTELLVIRCQGKGMGGSPRSESLGEGLQMRVIAMKPDGKDGYSVSYTIPGDVVHSLVTQNARLPILYRLVMDAVAALEAHATDLRQLGAKRIGVFGSQARGDATPASDVDVYVEFVEGQRTFRNFNALYEFLESLFSMRIELVVRQD